MDEGRRQVMRWSAATISMFGAARFGNAEDIKSPSEQAHYLFWLKNLDRQAIQESTQYILAHFDKATSRDRADTLGLVHSQSSQELRSRYSIVAFSNRVNELRRQTGRIVQRSLQGIDGGFLKLPGMTEGYYAIAVFNSLYECGQDIYTEQVTVKKDSHSNEWQLVEYYLDLKPYYSYS
jgi:hypothetical protein